jgi:TolB-like protein/rhodanese-related sulfurtransferase
MVEGDDLYGDGVNVAARLEGLAESGGICLSQQAYDQVETKLDLKVQDLGNQKVKNIVRPVRAYRVLRKGEAPTPRKSPRLFGVSGGQLVGSATVLVVIVAALIAGWWQPWVPDVEPASVERMAFPLPERPSIAILPFANMSDDPKQEYFADGMTEDLITDLSKLSGLFVIARNSSFSYKGQQVKVRKVAEDLGVRFVLEGSVRRAGDEVRINAQLIDATTGGHLWAERYDGTLQDVFAFQDQVTGKIVAALAISLTGAEQAQLARRDTDNAEAHDAYLQGWARYKLLTPKNLAEAVPFFEEALRLDPAYAQAHAALASLYWDVLQNDWAFDLDMPSMRAEEFANTHLEEALKIPIPLAHVLQARMLASWGYHDDAVVEVQQAVALDHNDATAHAGLADTLVLAGRAAEAVEPIETAIRLDPHPPPSYLITLGAIRFGMKQYEKAAEIFERAAKLNPDNEMPLIYLASSYGHLGRIDDADDAIETANALRNTIGLGELSIRPSHRFSGYPTDKWDLNFKRFGTKATQDHLRAGLTDIPALQWQYLLAPGGRVMKGATQIDIPTAKSFHDRGAIFIDTSGESMWNAGHIPGAVHLSRERSENPGWVRFSKTTLRDVAGYDDEIVLYFDDGADGTAAWDVVKAVPWGYRKLYFFEGGAKAWKDAGYPVETGR